MHSYAMKHLIFVLFLSCGGVSAEGLRLSTGQSFTYQFSSLPILQGAPVSPTGAFRFSLGDDILDPGEVVRTRMFEGNTSGRVIREDQWGDLLDPWPNPVGMLISGAEGAWQDLHGAVQVTMLSGSIGLSTLRLDVIDSSYHYQQVVVIPEPSALTLFGLFASAAAIRSLLRLKSQARRVPPKKRNVANRK